jgi:hypothetical protein
MPGKSLQGTAENRYPSAQCDCQLWTGPAPLGVLSNYIYDLLRKKKYLPNNPTVKTLVIIIFLFLPFILITVLREILPDLMKEPETEVITYIPKEPGIHKEGNCFHASISIKRPGVWRCTVGNLIFDPCFEIPVNLAYSNNVHKIICKKRLV